MPELMLAHDWKTHKHTHTHTKVLSNGTANI
jgi:hypothetical protein